MPFWKKAYQKKQGVYYPQAIVQGKPVETETIAKDLTKISTVSNSDVQAVLGDIAGVMHTRMAQGKSVHIKGPRLQSGRHHRWNHEGGGHDYLADGCGCHEHRIAECKFRVALRTHRRTAYTDKELIRNRSQMNS